MEMQIGVAVRIGNLLVVDLAEPVVSGDGSGIGKNQAAHRIGHGRVFFYSPVGYLQIAVHKPLIVQYGGTHITELFAVFAVQDYVLATLSYPVLCSVFSTLS